MFVASVVDLELSKLQPFFDRNWATFGEKMPAEAVAKLQRMIYLRAVFQMHSSSPPQISLHMPEHLAALIGKVHNFKQSAWKSQTHCMEDSCITGSEWTGATCLTKGAVAESFISSLER